MGHTQDSAIVLVDLNERNSTIPTRWQRTGDLPNVSVKNRMKRTFLSNLPGAKDRHQHGLRDRDSRSLVWNISARRLVARVCRRGRYNHIERRQEAQRPPRPRNTVQRSRTLAHPLRASASPRANSSTAWHGRGRQRSIPPRLPDSRGDAETRFAASHLRSGAIRP